MPINSQRSQAIHHSPIRSLVPYARAAEAKGRRIYYLNIGQPDIPTPPNALKAIADFDEKIIKYGDSEGKKSLRLKVAKYYEKFNIKISADEIMVTTGASEAIMFALFACFDEGQEIIIPEPFYANYFGFTKMTGINLVSVGSSIDQAFKLPDPADFEAIITPSTKAIFLCNPGNPTGQLYSKEELLKLAAIIKKYDLFLIVDEVYREFCYDDVFTSVLTFDDIREQVIVIDSISKVFSACGSRIGYLVSRNRDILNAVIKFAQLRLCPPAIGQIVAEACYEDLDAYLDPVREEYRSRRDLMYQRLKAMPEVKCYLPKAAFYILAELPIDDSVTFCKWLLTDFDHEGQTVMFSPGSGFYLNSELGKRQIRIAFILNKERINNAMDCLERALVEYREIVMEKESAWA